MIVQGLVLIISGLFYMNNSGFAFLTQTDAKLKQYDQENISMMVAEN